MKVSSLGDRKRQQLSESCASRVNAYALAAAAAGVSMMALAQPSCGRDYLHSGESSHSSQPAPLPRHES
jgi:hypothetical protein